MKILLIDDESSCLGSLVRALKPTGHKCVAVSCPNEAIELLQKEFFDLVVTDYKMPETNGIQILRKAKEIDPRTAVIILTGFADVNNAIDAVNYGAYAFFRKPLQIEDFIKTISQLEKELIEKRIQELSISRLNYDYEMLQKKYQSLEKLIEDQKRNAEETL